MKYTISASGPAGIDGYAIIDKATGLEVDRAADRESAVRRVKELSEESSSEASPKMVHHWSAMLDEHGMIVVSEHARTQPGLESICLGDMIKLHAAMIEFVHRKVLQMLETHSPEDEEYSEGLEFFNSCVEAACAKTDDFRLLDILKSRQAEGASAPVDLIAEAIDAARVAVNESSGQDQSPALRQLRHKLAALFRNNLEGVHSKDEGEDSDG